MENLFAAMGRAKDQAEQKAVLDSIQDKARNPALDGAPFCTELATYCCC